ncbi:hypothetical protein Ancab_029059 [Ancistrocladus abbreviatus]
MNRAAALFAIFILAAVSHHAAAVASHHEHAPAPSQWAPYEPIPAPPSEGMDCMSVVFNMADCISYLNEGSNDTKPDKWCCQGLQEVLNMNASCLCYALKNSAELGIDLNMTRAATLPSLCHVQAPPISKCGISLTPPSEAPGHTPSHHHHHISPPLAPGKSPAQAPGPSAATGLASSWSLSCIMMTMVATCLTYLLA